MAKKKSGSSKRTSKKSSKKASRKASKKRTGAKKSARKSAKKSTRKPSTKTSARKTARKTSGGKKSAAGKSAGKSAKSSRKSRKQTKPRSPLSKKELRHFRDMLLEKRHDLVGDLTGIEAGALRNNRQDGVGDLSNMPTHPADIGSDNYEQEFSLGLMESERQLLKEIDEALERIADNTYGICLGTGKPIPKPRLEARPWARYCIDYARKIEQGLVSPRDAEEDEDRLFGRDEDEDEEIEDEEDLDESADDEDAEDVEDED